jgi:hypothetical protein
VLLGWPYPEPMDQDPGSRKRPADDVADADQDAVSQDGSQSMPPAKRIITTGEWPQEWHNEWELYWSHPEPHQRQQVWARWPKQFKTCAIRRAGAWRREEMQKWQMADLAAAARANAAKLRTAAEQAVSNTGAPAPAAPPHEPVPPRTPQSRSATIRLKVSASARRPNRDPPPRGPPVVLIPSPAGSQRSPPAHSPPNGDRPLMT